MKAKVAEMRAAKGGKGKGKGKKGGKGFSKGGKGKDAFSSGRVDKQVFLGGTTREALLQRQELLERSIMEQERWQVLR